LFAVAGLLVSNNYAATSEGWKDDACSPKNINRRNMFVAISIGLRDESFPGAMHSILFFALHLSV
jgi:hypothetical protein